MGLKDSILTKTKEFRDTKFKFESVSTIPTVETKQLTFGCNGWSFDATVLYIDMRHSTQLLDDHRRNVVAKLHMAYYNAIAAIAKNDGGEIRSFNGDSLLVFFLGADKSTVNKAVRSAFKMKYAIDSLVNPTLKEYKDINFGVAIDCGNIVATKVGIKGDGTTKDLIWLGDAVNRSTKISDLCENPFHVGISHNTYLKLDESLLSYKDSYGWKNNVWIDKSFIYNEKAEQYHISSCQISFN